MASDLNIRTSHGEINYPYLRAKAGSIVKGLTVLFLKQVMTIFLPRASGAVREDDLNHYPLSFFHRSRLIQICVKGGLPTGNTLKPISNSFSWSR